MVLSLCIFLCGFVITESSFCIRYADLFAPGCLTGPATNSLGRVVWPNQDTSALQTHTHTHTHTHARARTHTPTHTPTTTPTHPPTHTHTHTIRMCIFSPSQQTHADTHSKKKHADTHSNKHMRTHTSLDTYHHTGSLTNTQPLSYGPSCEVDFEDPLFSSIFSRENGQFGR